MSGLGIGRIPARSLAAMLASVLVAAGAFAADEKQEKKEEAKDAKQAVNQTGPKEPGRTLRGHTETVYQVAFSPDGSILATASFDNTIKLWRVSDGMELGTLSGHTGKVLSIAFSADGRSLLSGSEDKTLKLWNVPVGGPAQLSGHTGTIHALASSPDGALLVSAGEDKTVRVWKRAAGKEELKIEGLPAAVLSLAVNAEGTRLLGGLQDGTLRLWALAAPPPPAPAAAPAVGAAELVPAGAAWRLHKGKSAPPGDWSKPGFDSSKWERSEAGFGYSSDEKELSTVKTKLSDMMGGYVSLYIRKTFKVEDPKAVEKLTLKITYDDGFVAYLNGAEVGRANVEGSPPGHDAIGTATVEATEVSLDLTPHLAKLAAGDNVLAIQGHNHSASSSDFVLSPSLSATLKAAPPPAPPKPPEIEVAKPGSELKKIEGLGGPVLAIAVSPDGKRAASAGESGAVRVHSLADGAEVAKLEGHQGAVRGLAFIDGDTLASAGADKVIRVWNLAEKKEARSLSGHGAAITALSLRADRKLLASASEDKTVKLWDPASGKELKSISDHEAPVLAVALSAAKEVVTGSADKTLRVFNAEDGKPLGSFTNPAEVRAAAVSGDGRYYAASGQDVFEWRATSLAAVRTFTGHGDIVHSVAFSPDHQTIASAGADKTIRTWNLADGKQLKSINAHGSSVYCVAYSPDGTQLASGGFDKLVKIWNVADGAEVKKLEGHEEGVFCLAYDADGNILSGSSDRSIRKWNVKEGKLLQTFTGHPGWISDLRIVPGKHKAVSVDYGGNLLVWDLDKGQPVLTRKLPAIVHGLALSADLKWLATANGEGSTFLFESPAEAR
jgi:WD40 repeat protein